MRDGPHTAEAINDCKRVRTDYLFHNLQETHGITSVEVMDGFHQVLEGKNGEGVVWKTDGRLFIGLLASE